MREKKLWAKIVHDEGVVFEKKYATEAEAKAFVDGYNATVDSLDVEDRESYFACADDSEAMVEA